MHADQNTQRGVALVLALLIVALAAIVAAAIMSRADGEFRRAERLLHGEQALHYVIGAEQWVMQILYRDRRDSTTDHRGENWAVELPPLPVDGGVVIGRLDDLGGRFNLTNLINDEGKESPAHRAQLERLVQVLGLEAQIPVAAIVDLIDADSEPGIPDGAEDSVYLAGDLPQRTPNRPLMVLSELVLLRDVDAGLLAVIAPHVATLPARTALNINTMSAPVLMSLADELDERLATDLMEGTLDSGFPSVESLAMQMGVNPRPGVGLALASNWFQLTVRVNIGTTDLTMYSLLERLPDGRTRVVARRRTPW